MSALALLFVLMGAPLGQGPETPPQDAEPDPVLAERARVAGIEALLSVSTLIYEGYPDRPHELFAIYAFPDRALWHLSLFGGPATERVIEYRSGDVCWRIERLETSSRRLDAVERNQLVLRMELRRALLLWPDGFDWKPAGGLLCADLGELGRLEAAVESGAAPARLCSFDGTGTLAETFDAIAWQRAGGRTFPKSARFSAGATPIWSETFHEISPGVHCLDSYFVPADRKPPRPGLVRGTQGALEVDLAPRAVLLEPLEPGLEWTPAVERSALLRAELERALDARWVLAPGFEVELTAGGHPQAVVFSLETPGEGVQLPPGWSTSPAERILEVSLTSLPTPDSGGLGAHLEALRREVPRGSNAGSARVWFDPQAPPERRLWRVRISFVP